VAIYRRDTFGAYLVLTRPRTMRRVVVRHVDYGPAPWTGKTLDLNPPAAQGLGFSAPGGCVRAFPTGEWMRARVISRRVASRWAKRTVTRVDDRFIFSK
jgi:hypothetical protein